MHHIAVIGSGFIGKAHAQVIKSLPQARLAAIINPNPKPRNPWQRSWAAPGIHR